MSNWENAHTEYMVVPGVAGAVTTDLTPVGGTVYRILYAEAWHDGAANRNLQWVVIATAAGVLSNAVAAVSGVKQQFYAQTSWHEPLTIHNGETLRINSDVIAGEHCNIGAVVEVIRGTVT